MKNHNKLTQQQKAQEELAAHQSQSHSGLEFKSPEELLRFDAAQTEVPGRIAGRLRESTAELRPPARPWYKRIFGG